MAHEDEEIIEGIKTWWKKNGTALMLAIAVGLFSFAGWRYWHSTNTETATQAQSLQQQMQIAVQRLSVNASDKNIQAEVQRLGDELMNNYSRTPYSQDAALLLAKVAVEQNNLPKAITLLKGVIADSGDDAKVALAQSRLARVQAAKGDFADALSTLDAIKDKSLAPLVNEIRGDIFVLQNKTAEAKVAYQAADAALAARNESRPILELKLADVGLEPAARTATDLEH